MPQPNALRLVVWITLSSSLLGALFAFAENRLHGVLAGGLKRRHLSSLEILVLRGAYGASLHQLGLAPSACDLSELSSRSGPEGRVARSSSRLKVGTLLSRVPMVAIYLP
jgi:hypothetical protein